MIMPKKLLNFSHIFLVAILVVAFFLRTYKLHEALGDWHSWRQVDTASVAREYVKAGKIDFTSPKFHDLSSIPSGRDNLEGWRMVEFPLRDGLHASLYKAFPNFGFLEWGRMISIISSLLTIIFVYIIVLKLSGSLAAIFTALIYAVLPYNIFYGRVILPEPMLVMFTTLTLLLYILYCDTGKARYWLGTLLSLTLSFLLKPTSAIIIIPMFGYFLASPKKSMKIFLHSSLILPLAIIPYYFWRKHISNYPEGIPASSWLFNSNGIRFKGSWFHWLFGERVGKLILGFWGLIPFGFGVVKLGENKKETLVYGGLLLGSLSYLSIIATGNVQHDYYQIQIMPTISILSGVGMAYMISLKKGFAKLVISLFAIFTLALGCALSWYELKGYFWVNNRAMVEAGNYLDKNIPSSALVIAPYQGDTAFLFQTNRRGWPIGGEIDKKISLGASYYVTTTRDQEWNELKLKYGVVVENDKFGVIHLVK